MVEARRRVDIAPAPAMQSMVAIEGSVGYKSWSHASFFPCRKSADMHTKSYHFGMTKLKTLKHLKTRVKIQNGFTETQLHRQRRVCCHNIYDPYGDNTETWLELLEVWFWPTFLGGQKPLAGSCLVQISQQQAVLPCFIVHRFCSITVWMHSSWARFH